MSGAASGILDIFTNPKNFTGEQAKQDKKRSKRRTKTIREERKRADDLTNAFGKTLLNDPLGKSRSLLQGRPGGAGGGSVLGG